MGRFFTVALQPLGNLEGCLLLQFCFLPLFFSSSRFLLFQEDLFFQGAPTKILHKQHKNYKVPFAFSSGAEDDGKQDADWKVLIALLS